MTENIRPLLPVGLFSALYVGVAVIGATITGNSEFIFYIVVMVVLATVIVTAHLRIKLPLIVLWAFSLWGLAHMAGGLMPVPESWPIDGDKRVLYSLWLLPGLLKYDQVVHAYGFGITTWLCWLGLRCAFSRQGLPVAPTSGLLLLCWAGGLGFGALNEVIEFIAVLSMPETNVGGYINTGWDLVANMVGASLAVLMVRLGHGKSDDAQSTLRRQV